MPKAWYKQAGFHLKKQRKCRKLDETVKGIKLEDWDPVQLLGQLHHAIVSFKTQKV